MHSVLRRLLAVLVREFLFTVFMLWLTKWLFFFFDVMALLQSQCTVWFCQVWGLKFVYIWVCCDVAVLYIVGAAKSIFHLIFWPYCIKVLAGEKKIRCILDCIFTSLTWFEVVWKWFSDRTKLTWPNCSLTVVLPLQKGLKNAFDEAILATLQPPEPQKKRKRLKFPKLWVWQIPKSVNQTDSRDLKQLANSREAYSYFN